MSKPDKGLDSFGSSYWSKPSWKVNSGVNRLARLTSDYLSLLNCIRPFIRHINKAKTALIDPPAILRWLNNWLWTDNNTWVSNIYRFLSLWVFRLFSSNVWPVSTSGRMHSLQIIRKRTKIGNLFTNSPIFDSALFKRRAWLQAKGYRNILEGGGRIIERIEGYTLETL